MRLSSEEKHKIIHYAKKYFDADARLYLFGSRIDDAKKGGDIDLFLDSPHQVDMQAQINFLTAIYKNVTERKIDLLVNSPAKQHQAIYQTAKQQGVLLC